MMKGMYTAQISPDDDPSSLHVPEPEKEDGIAAILSEELFQPDLKAVYADVPPLIAGL